MEAKLIQQRSQYWLQSILTSDSKTLHTTDPEMAVGVIPCKSVGIIWGCDPNKGSLPPSNSLKKVLFWKIFFWRASVCDDRPSRPLPILSTHNWSGDGSLYNPGDSDPYESGGDCLGRNLRITWWKRDSPPPIQVKGSSLIDFEYFLEDRPWFGWILANICGGTNLDMLKRKETFQDKAWE